MPQVITLEGLPEPVAKALIETVNNLKRSYRLENTVAELPAQKTPAERTRAWEEYIATLPPMPVIPDYALRREFMYAPENEEH